MAPRDCREAIVAWKHWGIENHQRYVYTEGPARMGCLTFPAHGVITCDCSADFTYGYKWAGAKDPNDLHFDGEGYTGTLIEHGKPVELKDLRPGDAVIYFADSSLTGTGVHVATVISLADTPQGVVTASMGQQGDPSRVTVGEDGRPFRFYTFDTMGAPTYPPGWHESTPQPPEKPATVTPVPSSPKDVSAPLGAGPQSVPFKVLRTGSAGSRVRLVQKARRLNPSGIYGRKTRVAVGVFQKSHGLPVTGVVDEATWKELGL
jgi:hypothetical protein